MTVQDIDGLDAEAKLWIEFRCFVVGPFVEFRCFGIGLLLSGAVSLVGFIEFRSFLLGLH